MLALNQVDFKYLNRFSTSRFKTTASKNDYNLVQDILISRPGEHLLMYSRHVERHPTKSGLGEDMPRLISHPLIYDRDIPSCVIVHFNFYFSRKRFFFSQV